MLQGIFTMQLWDNSWNRGGLLAGTTLTFTFFGLNVHNREEKGDFRLMTSSIFKKLMDDVIDIKKVDWWRVQNLKQYQIKVVSISEVYILYNAFSSSGAYFHRFIFNRTLRQFQSVCSFSAVFWSAHCDLYLSPKM